MRQVIINYPPVAIAGPRAKDKEKLKLVSLILREELTEVSTRSVHLAESIIAGILLYKYSDRWRKRAMRVLIHRYGLLGESVMSVAEIGNAPEINYGKKISPSAVYKAIDYGIYLLRIKFSVLGLTRSLGYGDNEDTVFRAIATTFSV